MSERCIKCGNNTDIAMRYDRSYRDCLFHERNDDGNEKEHLHYYCRNCSYSWTGPILDGSEILGVS